MLPTGHLVDGLSASQLLEVPASVGGAQFRFFKPHSATTPRGTPQPCHAEQLQHGAHHQGAVRKVAPQDLREELLRDPRVLQRRQEAVMRCITGTPSEAAAMLQQHAGAILGGGPSQQQQQQCHSQGEAQSPVPLPPDFALAREVAEFTCCLPQQQQQAVGAALPLRAPWSPGAATSATSGSASTRRQPPRRAQLLRLRSARGAVHYRSPTQSSGGARGVRTQAATAAAAAAATPSPAPPSQAAPARGGRRGGKVVAPAAAQPACDTVVPTLRVPKSDERIRDKLAEFVHDIYTDGAGGAGGASPAAAPQLNLLSGGAQVQSPRQRRPSGQVVLSHANPRAQETLSELVTHRLPSDCTYLNHHPLSAVREADNIPWELAAWRTLKSVPIESATRIAREAAAASSEVQRAQHGGDEGGDSTGPPQGETTTGLHPVIAAARQAQKWYHHTHLGNTAGKAAASLPAATQRGAGGGHTLRPGEVAGVGGALPDLSQVDIWSSEPESDAEAASDGDAGDEAGGENAPMHQVQKALLARQVLWSDDTDHQHGAGVGGGSTLPSPHGSPALPGSPARKQHLPFSACGFTTEDVQCRKAAILEHVLQRKRQTAQHQTAANPKKRSLPARA